ncbi:hypothetical protein B0H10DRAFT_1950201 [Mycena sp. CBHHK59/15]|nr:hypothetical protein B0H10DRAFT_1950201 [Mycena sp. CBHHK59/15]
MPIDRNLEYSDWITKNEGGMALLHRCMCLGGTIGHPDYSAMVPYDDRNQKSKRETRSQAKPSEDLNKSGVQPGTLRDLRMQSPASIREEMPHNLVMPRPSWLSQGRTGQDTQVLLIESGVVCDVVLGVFGNLRNKPEPEGEGVRDSQLGFKHWIPIQCKHQRLYSPAPSNGGKWWQKLRGHIVG